MEVKGTSPRIIEAATGLLQPLAPELTAQNLVEALRQYEPGQRKRYMTRAEAAARMRISLVTLHRLINDGKVKSVRVTPKAVRIDADSVEALLSGNATGNEGRAE